MADDFPAAHSMDTDWYAVDRSGHVAVFCTGENGHVPEGAGDDTVLRDWWQLRHPGVDPEQYYEWDTDGAAARLGFFCYSHDESYEVLSTYSRDAAPDAPLHLDELPPDLRRRCKLVRFDALDFAQSPRVQPQEFFACTAWYTGHVAYLCGDGKTVRPMPGKEAEFAEFCQQLQAQNPEWAARLRFEGPTPGPGQTPGRPQEAG
jgi:hypothetical protein